MPIVRILCERCNEDMEPREVEYNPMSTTEIQHFGCGECGAKILIEIEESHGDDDY